MVCPIAQAVDEVLGAAHDALFHGVIDAGKELAGRLAKEHLERECAAQIGQAAAGLDPADRRRRMLVDKEGYVILGEGMALSERAHVIERCMIHKGTG
jgi:hypothetical protein